MEQYGDVPGAAYRDLITLETDASGIQVYCPNVVHGLLPTVPYARAVIGATAITRTPEEVTALAEVRQARQAVLTRPGNPLKVWAIIHEVALRQQFPAQLPSAAPTAGLPDCSRLPTRATSTYVRLALRSVAVPGAIGAELGDLGFAEFDGVGGLSVGRQGAGWLADSDGMKTVEGDAQPGLLRELVRGHLSRVAGLRGGPAGEFTFVLPGCSGLKDSGKGTKRRSWGSPGLADSQVERSTSDGRASSDICLVLLPTKSFRPRS